MSKEVLKTIEIELNDWIEIYSQQLKTNFEDLPEAAMLEIIEFLKEDGFSEEEINKQINELNQ